MNVTNFFGEYLSKLTERRAMACKGMIRLAVLDKHPTKTPDQLLYTELKDIFDTTLKTRLENVSIPNTEQISKEIVSYLVKNQSLLTMA
ncbi:hypothetical protein LCGC14_0874500 [marine sediment metagenome]|uniref:Uncharacterized protein n=1 Tax=marine sediment metagenome TaxID=412755 RepID=A0A0F9SAQ4_9ZZZZ|nr:MAG: hypothetical protein Lokiarch_42580 [Candidatus Lokiarchaeum sp. GC14_75]HEC40634.1 hypothetical protein [bacterium]